MVQNLDGALGDLSTLKDMFILSLIPKRRSPTILQLNITCSFLAFFFFRNATRLLREHTLLEKTISDADYIFTWAEGRERLRIKEQEPHYTKSDTKKCCFFIKDVWSNTKEKNKNNKCFAKPWINKAHRGPCQSGYIFTFSHQLLAKEQ